MHVAPKTSMKLLQIFKHMHEFINCRLLHKETSVNDLCTCTVRINGQCPGTCCHSTAFVYNMKENNRLDRRLHYCRIKNYTYDLMIFIFHLFHMQLWIRKANLSRQFTWCPISSKSPNPSYDDLLNHEKILNLMVQVLILPHAYMLQRDPESLPMSFLLNSSQ